jgi:hypothetical protein
LTHPGPKKKKLEYIIIFTPQSNWDIYDMEFPYTLLLIKVTFLHFCVQFTIYLTQN